jgi:DNA-binding transcriptional LysR family regulator
MLDRLTLDQLRILIAVAETGSFSAAGRRLGRVQSAISQAVQLLETALGIALFDRAGKSPVLTAAGRVLLDDARQVVRGAEMMRVRAQSVVSGIEAELTLAVEQVFPSTVLMESLKAFAEAFPLLPVTIFTEGLSAAETRLHDGLAQLGIYWPPFADAPDFEATFFGSVPLVPVVAATHPLAGERAPLTSDVLARHVQLVWTDRSPSGVSGGIVSSRVWRFADLGSRLEYLLAGFGWCNMPMHMVETHIAAGRLNRLELKEHGGRLRGFPLYVVHKRNHPPGRAGRWLIDDLRKRFPDGEYLDAPRGTRDEIQTVRGTNQARPSRGRSQKKGVGG